MDILRLLMLNHQNILSKETLLIKVWGYDTDAGDNNVEAYISFLRKKLMLAAFHRGNPRGAPARIPTGGKQPVIQKLRKKLMIVLMTILCLLLVAILGGMFYSAKMVYERRYNIAFSDPPPAEDTLDRSLRLAIPIASVSLNTSGEYTVTQNQIHYVTDDELIKIAQSLR